MSRNVNKVFILGNVTKDPELRHTDSGTAVTNFSIATNESYKDANGEWQERPQFHNVTAWAKQAEIIVQYVRKGTQMHVEGSLNYGSYEKDGVTIRTTEIRIDEFALCGRPGGASAPAEETDTGTDEEAPAVNPDDELPF